MSKNRLGDFKRATVKGLVGVAGNAMKNVRGVRSLAEKLIEAASVASVVMPPQMAALGVNRRDLRSPEQEGMDGMER